MKKLALLILFTTLLIFPLFSATIEGHGSGSTKEEALLKARQDLLTSIQVNVFAETTVSVLDDGTTQENLFSSSSTSFASGILKGREEKTTQKADGSWEAVCLITEDHAYIYEDSLKNAINSINNCQKEIDKGLTAKEEIEYLQIQVEQYELFDFYREILVKLEHPSADKPLVGIEYVHSRYNIVFSQIDAPAIAETNTEESNAELQKELSLYEERKKLNDELKKQNELELQEYQKKLSQEQKETLSSYNEKAQKAYKALAYKSYAASYDSKATAFIDARSTLRTLYEDNISSLESLNKSSAALISETRSSIFARPYDAIAEMKNGQPTEKALAERTRIANEETQKVIEEQNQLYVEAFKSFKTAAQQLYSVYNTKTSYINGNFVITSTSNGTSFVIGKYDASSYSWPFAYSFTILGHSITVNGTISDEEVLKLGKEAESDWRKDSEYRALVEFYDAFFHTENTLEITCNLTSSVVASTGKIDIDGLSYLVTRLDNSSNVSTGTQEASFSYEYEKADSLELVFYALGGTKEEAEKNAKELFLGDTLAPQQSLYKISSEDKEDYAIAKIVIKESTVSQIEAIQDSLETEYYNIKNGISRKTKSYNDLLEKLEIGVKVSDILVAFGKSAATPFKDADRNRTNYTLNALRETYVKKINAGIKESDLNDSALELINSITSKISTVETSGKEDFKAFCDAYKQLVAKRKRIQGKITSDETTYSEEEIKKDYSNLKLVEEEVLSNSTEITLSSDVFVPSVVIDELLVENLRIKYVINKKEFAELAGLEFEIPLSNIAGTAPTKAEDKEAYYQKLLGAVYLFNGNSAPFTITLKLSVSTNSTGKDGLISEYIPFTQSQIMCTYSIQSSYDSTVFKAGSLVFSQETVDALSSFSVEASERASYEEQLAVEKKEEKKENTKNAVVNFFKEATYGITVESPETVNLATLRISAIKWNDHTFYGFGVGFLYHPFSKDKTSEEKNSNSLGGFGINAKIGVKTSVESKKVLKLLNLFLTASAFGSLDVIPTLNGMIPNLTVGGTVGMNIYYFIVDMHIEGGFAVTLGKNSAVGLFASVAITLPMHAFNNVGLFQ